MDNTFDVALVQRGKGTTEELSVGSRRLSDVILEAQKPYQPRPKPDYWGELSADLTKEAQEKLATNRSKVLEKKFPSFLSKYDVDHSQTLDLNEVRTAAADQSQNSSDRAMLSFMENNHDKIRRLTYEDREPHGISQRDISKLHEIVDPRTTNNDNFYPATMVGCAVAKVGVMGGWGALLLMRHPAAPLVALGSVVGGFALGGYAFYKTWSNHAPHNAARRNDLVSLITPSSNQADRLVRITSTPLQITDGLNRRAGFDFHSVAQR